jgi:lipopolysaccharide transport system permease protein
MHSRNVLLYQAFLRREVTSRYVGSASGMLWALASPLAQLAVLSVVFSHIFCVESGPATYGLQFVTFVAVALWPWIMFSESVNRGLAAITGNGELVRKVAFPHILLVLSTVSAVYLVNLAGFVAVIVALDFIDPALHLSGLPAFLLALLPHFVLSLAAAMVLAAVQAFVRDMAHVMAVLLSILFYATPIVYPSSMVPESFRAWLALNPHAFFSERFREAMSGAATFGGTDLAWLAACVVLALAGFWFFRRLSPYFEELV